jgi:8-oxo-dGTP diphosphatase
LGKAKVVIGIITDGSKFLVERRRKNERIDPGIVCLPGGHVKKNESCKHALQREMREELGIEVNKVKFVSRATYIASNGEMQESYCFLVTDYEGKPTCKAAQDVLWEENTNKLSLDADRKAIAKTKKQSAF